MPSTSFGLHLPWVNGMWSSWPCKADGAPPSSLVDSKTSGCLHLWQSAVHLCETVQPTGKVLLYRQYNCRGCPEALIRAQCKHTVPPTWSLPWLTMKTLAVGAVTVLCTDRISIDGIFHVPAHATRGVFNLEVLLWWPIRITLFPLSGVSSLSHGYWPASAQLLRLFPLQHSFQPFANVGHDIRAPACRHDVLL